MKPTTEADKIIDALGGTAAVAKLCEVTEPAVSQWRSSETGIPNGRLMFLKAIRPDVFVEAPIAPDPMRDRAKREAANGPPRQLPATKNLRE